jgi:hypothetical protein
MIEARCPPAVESNRRIPFSRNPTLNSFTYGVSKLYVLNLRPMPQNVNLNLCDFRHIFWGIVTDWLILAVAAARHPGTVRTPPAKSRMFTPKRRAQPQSCLPRLGSLRVFVKKIKVFIRTP